MSYPERESSVFQGQPYELYKFEMGADQSVPTQWFLTSGDKARTYDGEPYIPTAMSRTAVGRGGEQKSNAMKVTIPRDHAVAQLFKNFLPASPVTLVVYRNHEGEAEGETIVQFTGSVTSASFGEDCELNCAPEEQVLRQKIPWVRYQTPCNKIIYSTPCGVDKEAFRIEATVTAVDGDDVTAAEFDAQPDGWFDNGYLEWGEQKRMIIRHVGDTVTLIVAMEGLIVNEAVSAFPGCARTYQAACIAKFHKGPNFWGFEWIPRRNPFKGVEY